MPWCVGYYCIEAILALFVDTEAQPLIEKEISTPSNLTILGQTHITAHDNVSASCSDHPLFDAKTLRRANKNLYDCGAIRTLNLLHRVSWIIDEMRLGH